MFALTNANTSKSPIMSHDTFSNLQWFVLSLRFSSRKRHDNFLTSGYIHARGTIVPTENGTQK